MITHIGLGGGMGLGSLDPTDPCYDSNRPWWGYTDQECACLADSGRPIGEQCASFKGVTETMSGQVGSRVMDFTSAISKGFTDALFNNNQTDSQYSFMTIAILGLAGYLVVKKFVL